MGCGDTFMWLYKPIENRTEYHTHTQTHTLWHSLHSLQLFQRLIMCFHVVETSHTHTYQMSPICWRVQRESIFSVWGHCVNPPSFSGLVLSKPEAAAHVYKHRTHWGMLGAVWGPLDVLSRTAQGLRWKQKPKWKHMRWFWINLTRHLYPCYYHILLQSRALLNAAVLTATKLFSFFFSCPRRATFLTDEFSHKAACWLELSSQDRSHPHVGPTPFCQSKVNLEWITKQQLSDAFRKPAEGISTWLQADNYKLVLFDSALGGGTGHGTRKNTFSLSALSHER